jgi:hypothetical protein
MAVSNSAIRVKSPLNLQLSTRADSLQITQISPLLSGIRPSIDEHDR